MPNATSRASRQTRKVHLYIETYLRPILPHAHALREGNRNRVGSDLTLELLADAVDELVRGHEDNHRRVPAVTWHWGEEKGR